MKTPEEILEAICSDYEDFVSEKSGFVETSYKKVIQAMKLYANAKLDEAASLLNVDSSTDLWQEEILTLKDKI